MIEKFSNRLPKRKLNVFLICLICSFMAWSVSKLSESHTDLASFSLDFTEVPDSLILNKASKTDVSLRIRASGFRFLGLELGSHKLVIHLDGVRKGPSGFYLPRQLFLSQIEHQLPNSVDLLEMEGDTIFLEFLKVHSKKVPVVGQVSVELGHNHLLDGAIKLQPDSITIRGPEGEIDTISRVQTRQANLTDVTQDFDIELPISVPDSLTHASFSDSLVHVTGKVFRFSEKIIEVPVSVLHVPEGSSIMTFPATIPVLCKARIEQIKDLDADDFRITADYDSLRKTRSYLDVQLEEKPDAVHTAQLLQDRVEFIIKRE